MAALFVVRTSPAFDRLMRKLANRHPDLPDLFAAAITVLEIDPYNRTRRHNIKKLERNPSGKGQYRLRLGRWRFRYDIWGREVLMQYRGLRREDTYR